MNTFLRNQIMVVMQGCKGRANAMPRKVLLSILALHFLEHPLIELERDMREIISTDGSGICSCSKGYYIALDDIEAKDAVAYLDSYIIALAKRKRSILKAYPGAAEGVQGELGI